MLNGGTMIQNQQSMIFRQYTAIYDLVVHKDNLLGTKDLPVFLKLNGFYFKLRPQIGSLF